MTSQSHILNTFFQTVNAPFLNGHKENPVFLLVLESTIFKQLKDIFIVFQFLQE